MVFFSNLIRGEMSGGYVDCQTPNAKDRHYSWQKSQALSTCTLCRVYKPGCTFHVVSVG